MTTPYFWRQPLQYLRWASHEKPAIFYSIVIGSLGPLTVFVVPPIRHRLGDGPRETIPLTYPGMFFFLNFLYFLYFLSSIFYFLFFFLFIYNKREKKENEKKNREGRGEGGGAGGVLNENPKGKSI